MDTRLCFGVFAQILSFGRYESNISQTNFVYSLLRILSDEHRYDTPLNGKGGKEVYEPDKYAISKIVHCTINIPALADTKFKNISPEEYSKFVNIIEEPFKKVISYIVEDNKCLIILALRDIILNDGTIDNQHKDFFKIIFGSSKSDFLMQCEYSFLELLYKVFMYTLFLNESNKVGESTAKFITKKYIEEIHKQCSRELKWDKEKQLLTVLYRKNYFSLYDLLIKHNIPQFIEKVDPSCGIMKDYVYCLQDFINDLSNSEFIINDECEAEKNKKIIKRIQIFCNIFNAYVDYIGKNVFDGIYCDMNNKLINLEIIQKVYFPKPATNLLEFNKRTRKYRQTLINVYQRIYKCAMASYYEIDFDE